MKALFEMYDAKRARLRELADTLDTEKREATEGEAAEVKTLEREVAVLHSKIVAGQEVKREEQPKDADAYLREAMSKGQRQFTVSLRREINTGSLAETGILPIHEQEMLKPLRTGLIWDRVGCRVITGQTGTSLRWPSHGKVVAKWRGEGERAVTSNIDFSKLTVAPNGLSVACTVTRESLKGSGGVVEAVVHDEMPKGIIDAVNDALFTTEATYQEGGQTKTKKVVGPLVAAKANYKTTFAGTVPTRAELLEMKAGVAKRIGAFGGACWAMTEDMKAKLEDVKIDAGSGRFLCEGDRILGFPVYCTDAIEEGNIAFGDWSYQAAGFFGGFDMIIDPYTLAHEGETNFVLHTDFATVTLRPEAFALGVITPGE